MKILIATLLLSLSVFAQNQAPTPEMQKRFDAYKQKMEKLTADVKAIAVEYCELKVEIACNMKNGKKSTPEESYDAKEIAMFKEGEAKVKSCKEDHDCKLKASKEQMASMIEIFEKKCSKGDNKYCFNHKAFLNVAKGTELMETEAKWFAAQNIKK